MTLQLTANYGARELKLGYNRNLAKALLLSIGVHLALIGIYMLLSAVSATKPDAVRLPPTWQGGPVPRRNDPQLGPAAPRHAMSAPVGDTMILVDHRRFDTLPDVRVVDPTVPGSITSPLDTAIGGSVPTGPPTDGSNDSVRPKMPRVTNVAKEPKNSDVPIFIAVEKEPTFDNADLAARVVYPEIARRNKLEGTVVLSVLVDKYGHAVRTVTDRCTNTVFEAPARDAVLAIPYTPALQNNEPVAVWLQVPVVFELR